MTVNSVANSAASAETSQTETTPSTPQVSQDQFLLLLVEQLKNQDPMNPTDSSEFMSELAQFTQLQEVIGIHQDLGELVKASQA
jgi:flagellar basal-body rod modification protein FlgD